jgi:anthranilate/para-aminobenzoate synthase component II
MRKILIVDFEDSFTFNIASEFAKNKNQVVDVIGWRSLKAQMIEGSDLVVFGPGPGHPDEYQEIFPMIKKTLEEKKKKVVGICLGHQLIWSCLGLEIKRSSRPIHGQKVELILNSEWKKLLQTTENALTVQRYNSLAVVKGKKNFETEYLMLWNDGELLASYETKLITYQFHPESIGTTYPQMFFSLC